MQNCKIFKTLEKAAENGKRTEAQTNDKSR